MEKSMSVEERIRRAEQRYYNISNEKYGEIEKNYNNNQKKNDTEKITTSKSKKKKQVQQVLEE